MIECLILISYALGGTLIASFLACVPALHLYSVAGLLVLVLSRFEHTLPSQGVAMSLLGATVGFSVVNTIPSLFASAPDESTVWIVLPGQRFVLQGRGYEASVLAGIGSLGGSLALVLIAPVVQKIVPPIRQVIQPHLHWILGLVAVYVLLSEWPRGSGRGDTVWSRLWTGWESLLAGAATFALSGLLGVLLFYRPLVPVEVSFQGLTPAFVGLFAVPWVLQNLVSRTPIPVQHTDDGAAIPPGMIARGVGAGVLGGLLAAFLPIVNGSIGGLVAGQATAQRDDRLFILSQGACKVVYYVGALLFFFAPGLRLVRGGMAAMLRPVYVPYRQTDYWLAVAATAVCGALAFCMLLWLSRLACALVSRVDHRRISWGTLMLLIALVGGTTGWGGLLIALASTGIGLIPCLFGSRRMNCMGVLLVPVLLDMAGVGSAVATWLHLV